MPKLAVFRGRVLQYNHFLDKDATVIGRSREADVPLDSDAVSRKHMVVVRRGNLYVATDLGATNHALVNERPLDGQHVLRHGDRIEIAEHLLVFHQRSAPQLGSGGLTRRHAPELARTDMERKLDRTSFRKTHISQQIKEESTASMSNADRDALRAMLAERRGAHLAYAADGDVDVFPLKAEVAVIGWSDDCELQLPGRSLFTSHVARVERHGRKHVIVAMSRLHPVKVQGERVDELELKNGVRFTIDNIEFRYRTRVV